MIVCVSPLLTFDFVLILPEIQRKLYTFIRSILGPILPLIRIFFIKWWGMVPYIPPDNRTIDIARTFNEIQFALFTKLAFIPSLHLVRVPLHHSNRPLFDHMHQTTLCEFRIRRRSPTTFARNHRFICSSFLSVQASPNIPLYIHIRCSLLRPLKPSFSVNDFFAFSSPNWIWCLFVCHVFAYFSVRSLSYSFLYTRERPAQPDSVRPGHIRSPLCAWCRWLFALWAELLLLLSAVDAILQESCVYTGYYICAIRLLTHCSAWKHMPNRSEPHRTAPNILNT